MAGISYVLQSQEWIDNTVTFPGTINDPLLPSLVVGNLIQDVTKTYLGVITGVCIDHNGSEYIIFIKPSNG